MKATQSESCKACPWRREDDDEAEVGAGPPAVAFVPDPDSGARFVLAKLILLMFFVIALACIAGASFGKLPDETVIAVLSILAVAMTAVGYFYFKYKAGE